MIEPFHPDRHGGTFHRLAMLGSLATAEQEIWSSWNGFKHVWEASGWPFVGKPELNDRILLASNRKIVFLIRRNFLRRIVSNLICRQTKYWVGTQQEFRRKLEETPLRPLDWRAVQEQIARDKDAVEQRLASFKRRNVDVYLLTFEELFQNSRKDQRVQFELANKLFGFVNAPLITIEMFKTYYYRFFDSDINQWASPQVYRRIPNVDLIESHVGSDTTGWLFK